MSETSESSNNSSSEELDFDFSQLSMRKTFSYRSLGADADFRVLELFPGKFDDLIRFRLQEASWDIPPAYEAISYAWGDAEDTMDSDCEGEKFRITRSLYTTLQHFRKTDTSRFLWADAVCIDQLDRPELNHQVKNMRKIYEKATRTLIWLGADDAGYGRTAINVMKRVSPLMLQSLGLEQIDWKTFPPKPLSHILSEGDLTDAMSSVTPDQWKALEWLFLRPWFTRLWVIQEFHSSFEAITICGFNVIDTNVLILVADWLTNIPPQMRNAVGLTKRGTYIQACCTMSYPRFQVIYQSSISSVLHEAENYQATDPRDRVYAMLYLPHLAELWKDIPIDYKIPVKEVYKSVVAVSIEKEQDLTILNYVRPRQHGSTSWIPRWDCNPKSPPLLQYRSNFRATMCKPSPDFGIIGGDSLFVRGIDIGEITTMTEHRFYRALGYGNSTLDPSGEAVTAPKLPSERAKAWKELMVPTSRYPDDEKLVDVYCRVLGVIDREKEKDGLPERMIRFVATMCGDELPIYNSIDGIKERVAPLSKTQCQGLTSRVTNLARDRVVFTTDNGYVGMGSQKMRRGDRVVLLRGGVTPFVLRPRSTGYYKLVGECYVHDMMFGEYFSSLSAEEREGRQFEIH